MGILDLDVTNPADLERLRRALAAVQELGDADRDRGAELHARHNTAPDHGKYRDMVFPPYQYKPYPKTVYLCDGSERVVKSAEEHQHVGECYESPGEAREAQIRIDERRAQEAAHLAYEDRHLTGPALAEREAADALAEDHLVDVQQVLKNRAVVKERESDAKVNRAGLGTPSRRARA